MTERIELPAIESDGMIARRLVRGMPMPVRALTRDCAPLSSAQSTWGGKGGRGWECLGCSILSPGAFEARLPSPSAMVVASRRGQRRLPGREGALRDSNPHLAIATAAMPDTASDVRLSSPWRGGSRVAGPGGPQVSRRNSNPPHTRACARTRHPPTRTRPLLTTHTHTHSAGASATAAATTPPPYQPPPRCPPPLLPPWPPSSPPPPRQPPLRQPPPRQPLPLCLPHTSTHTHGRQRQRQSGGPRRPMHHGRLGDG